MTLYKLNLNEQGYSVQELDAVDQSINYYNYLDQGKNFAVVKTICYTEDNYNNNDPIYFEPPHKIPDSWIFLQHKNQDNVSDYIAFSLIKPDEKIKNIFFKEIERYWNRNVSEQKNALDRETEKYNKLCQQRDLLLSFASKELEDNTLSQESGIEMDI